VMDRIDGIDIFVGTAAVADYRPANPASCKIKKQSDKLDLCMERTVDILHAVSQLPRRPFVVGFAAETNDVENHARAKLERKNLDLIAANEVGDSKVFEQDDNALVLLWQGGGRHELGAGSKAKLGRDLARFIAERFNERHQVAPASSNVVAINGQR
jgi:phosphopantothenoylcysteine decarboxylase/phosphopantothenate--cysteine ligase